MSLADYFDKLSQNLKELNEDISKLTEDEKKKAEFEKEGDSQEKGAPPEDSRLKSLQGLTTFYSDEKQATKELSGNPIEQFINKRMREIFKG